MNGRAPIAIVLLLCGCGTSSTPADGGAASEAGVAPRDAGPGDAGSIDAGPFDAGPSDAGPIDAGPSLPFPTPVYYLGGRIVRSCCDPASYSGSVRMPAAAPLARRWDEWTFVGHASDPRVADAVGAARIDGDDVVVDLTLTAKATEFFPDDVREVFTAISPDGVVLTTTLVAGELHFTPESTARQAMALAGVRPRPRPGGHPDLFYLGAAPGDDARIEAAIPSVAGAIRARLLDGADTGVGEAGFARRDTTVFDRVDAAISDPSIGAPVVTEGSFDHIGTIELDGTEGLVAMWLGDLGPAAPVPVAAGTRRIGFLVTTTGPRTGDRLYARFADTSGGQSAASHAFSLTSDATRELPGAPDWSATTRGSARAGSSPARGCSSSRAVIPGRSSRRRSSSARATRKAARRSPPTWRPGSW